MGRDARRWRRFAKNTRFLPRIDWQGGLGWWIIPGAIVGVAIWIVLVLWIIRVFTLA